MAFEATKREWGELYAFFRLLADGYAPARRMGSAMRIIAFRELWFSARNTMVLAVIS